MSPRLADSLGIGAFGKFAGMASDRYADDLSDLADAIHGKAMRECRVAFPAEVVRYDASRQVVDVRPLVAEFYPSSTGDLGDVEQVFAGVIPNVPLLHPGAGACRITFPIQVGNTVEVICQDRSIDAWQAQGGRQAPADRRRHDLSDAIAIPGLHDDKHAWTGASTSAMTIGVDGGSQITIDVATGQVHIAGADDFVALASQVLAALNIIKSAISGAAVLAGDGGATFKTNIMAALNSGWPTSVGSSLVKVKS